MKLKIIIAASTFLIATPIIIGQTLPSPTDIPTPNSVSSSMSRLNSLRNTNVTNPLSSDILSQSGLNMSALSQSPMERAQSLRDQYKQGLLDDSRLPSLPDNSSQLGTLAKRFAEETFPQEFQAAKGMLALPQAAPSGFPTSLPTMIPSPTFLPSSVPSIFPTPTIPSL